jgi:hypothetical protein
MRWAFFVAACLAHAQNLGQTAADARARKVIDQAIQALGGDNFLKMEDRIESGRAYSFYRDQISGLDIAHIYTRYVTVPEGKTAEIMGQRERESFGKLEETGVLFTEKGAWEISWRGVKELPKATYDRYKDSTLRNIFYILRVRLHEPGMTFESRGADVINNQPVEIVDITDNDNRTVTVEFNQSTKLPVRQTYTHYNEQAKQRDEEVTLYSRYREENGVNWPHQIHRERNGDKVYEIFSESVQINKDLTDDLFSLPPEGSDPGKIPKRKK